MVDYLGAILGSPIAIAGAIALILLAIKKFPHGLMFASKTVLTVIAVGMVVIGAGFISVSSLTSSFSAAGSTTSTAAAGSDKFAIGTLSVLTSEKYSNSRAAVDNLVLKLFDANADPTDPNQAPVVNVSFTNGIASDTNRDVYCGVQYRAIMDSDQARTWYAEDLGKITFPCSSFNKDDGSLSYDTGVQVTAIATLDDILDETTTNGDIDGQSNCRNDTTNLNEIGIGSDEDACEADDDVVYDESVGDGSFYIQPTFSASGANQALRDYAVCFAWDRTDPPEGTEVTGLTWSHISGDTFSFVENGLSFWTNQDCMTVAKEMKGGESGKYRATFTVSEANFDPQDVFTMDVDDLGSRLGKDIGMDTGATTDRIRFNDTA